MITGSVRGREELRHVQTILTVDGPAELQKDLTSKARESLAGLKKDIPAAAELRLPHRGGYAQLLSKATKVSIRVSGGKRTTAIVDVSARGKTEVRDVSRLNKGELRHPDIRDQGKPRRFWRWHGQPVPPRMVDDPVDDARDRLVDGARDAAQEYANKVARG